LHDDLITRRVDLPGGVLEVLQPHESAELPDEGGVEWAPIAPYWSVLWRSGVALATELGAMDLADRRVIELGCGLAVPSIVAARAGAMVVATDVCSEALVLARRNADLNAAELETAVLDWTAPRVSGPGFDLVLAADVLYEPEAVAPLLELFDRLGATVLLADPGREPAAELIARARGRWDVDTVERGVVSIHRMRPVGSAAL